MIIGILREIKPEENRVAMTPAGVEVMKQNGHTILVEASAGIGSGFSDAAYVEHGAQIAAAPAEIFARADMVMHVKEPLPPEYGLIRRDQIVFTYLHLAAAEELTRVLLGTGAVYIAYETIQKADGTLPLLTPMSEVAGRMAIQQGAKYLEMAEGGDGMLLGGVPGVDPGLVLIIGGGVVGINAAKMACGLGAKVLITGAKAPRVVTRDMLRTMKKGAVMVDVAIDQGGSFETSRPTTHSHPTYIVDGVVHYCVANMPGAVPKTSTLALTNATLPYAVEIAGKGWADAMRGNAEIRAGANVVRGKVTFQGVADAWGIPYTPIEELL